MARTSKSQWEFGELFPPPEPKRTVLSVTELTALIRRVLEKHVGQTLVTGEVTNLRAQSSGHIYFTLKDAGAQLSCVLFRGEPRIDRSLLQDGRKVILQGEIVVYEPRGQYQLRVTSVELEGLGALQAAFEKLKQKLQAEGLFATERKRPLPRYPRRIGLVTSPSGAAIRDVLHVVRRRYPSLELVLAGCRVQGQGAELEIAAAIRALNRYSAARKAAGVPEQSLDVILVTRGGGSLEDLWCFNEEAVARAIYGSELPVISAVGHEIDFTISDFVADVRAATPSAAAEILTEGPFSSCQFLAQAVRRLAQLTRQHLADLRYETQLATERLGRAHPRRRVEAHLQHLDDLQGSLRRCFAVTVRQHRTRWQTLSARLSRLKPGLILAQRRELLRQTKSRLLEHAHHALRQHRSQVENLQARLKLLGPEQVLARGYSITTDARTGRVLRRAADAPPGTPLKTKLQTGQLFSRTEAEA